MQSPPVAAQLLSDRWPIGLLSRVEDAGINASAPPQQRWVDGWLVRYSPGKAKRARCIQAVADGSLSVDERLALCAPLFEAQGLPLIVRITPFSQPQHLDAHLVGQGYRVLDHTRVMVVGLPSANAVADPAGPRTLLLGSEPDPWPAQLQLATLSATAYAEAVGELRASPATHRLAHAQRLQHSPVPYQGWVLRQDADSPPLCCAQTAIDGDLVGLYDVFTAPQSRGLGLARQLCRHLLLQAAAQGCRAAYLQVDADNHPARRAYRHLGFEDAYSYHYRTADPSAL